jgi:chemotaxis protein CheD
MKVSNDEKATLITYSLSSCIGIIIYDEISQIGGIIHYMLPDSTLHADKFIEKPFMFADRGIPALFKASYELGAKKENLKVYVIGGSEAINNENFFNIGKANYMAAQKILEQNNVKINFMDIGGHNNRTVKLEIKTGQVWLKISGQAEKKI